MSIAKEHRWLLLAVCAAQFFMPFMVAGVNAVLPPLGESLGASARELSLLGGRLYAGAGRVPAGRRHPGGYLRTAPGLPFGLSLFSVLALVLGFIPHIDVFIGLRLFQGMGAAMLSSSSLALLASAAPKEMRASYLGLSGVAVYAGIACGPPVGGLVAGWLGWRWLFWGTGLAALAAMCIMIFRVPWVAHRRQGALRRAGLSALWRGHGGPDLWRVLYRGRSSPGRRALFCSVSCCWPVSSGGSCAVPSPMVDVRLLLRNRVLSLSLVAAFVNYCSFFGMVFFFSLYLQVGRGFSVQEAGLMLALQAAVQSLPVRWPPVLRPL